MPHHGLNACSEALLSESASRTTYRLVIRPTNSQITAAIGPLNPMLKTTIEVYSDVAETRWNAEAVTPTVRMIQVKPSFGSMELTRHVAGRSLGWRTVNRAPGRNSGPSSGSMDDTVGFHAGQSATRDSTRHTTAAGAAISWLVWKKAVVMDQGLRSVRAKSLVVGRRFIPALASVNDGTHPGDGAIHC